MCQKFPSNNSGIEPLIVNLLISEPEKASFSKLSLPADSDPLIAKRLTAIAGFTSEDPDVSTRNKL